MPWRMFYSKCFAPLPGLQYEGFMSAGQRHLRLGAGWRYLCRANNAAVGTLQASLSLSLASELLQCVAKGFFVAPVLFALQVTPWCWSDGHRIAVLCTYAS